MPAVRANRAHRYAIGNALHKLLACARQATDKVENAVVQEYFTTAGLEAVLDPLTQDVFKELVAKSQNPSRVVIWEVRAKYDRTMAGEHTLSPKALTMHCPHDHALFLMKFIG